MYKASVTYEVPEDTLVADEQNTDQLIDMVKERYGIILNRYQAICLAPLLRNYNEEEFFNIFKRDGFKDIIIQEPYGNRTVFSFEGFDDVQINNLNEGTGDNTNDAD